MDLQPEGQSGRHHRRRQRHRPGHRRGVRRRRGRASPSGTSATPLARPPKICAESVRRRKLSADPWTSPTRPPSARPWRARPRRSARSITSSTRAAIGSGKFGFPFTNLAPADWPRVLQVNVMGMVNVAHASRARHGRARRRARWCSSPRSPGRSARRPTRPTAPPRPRNINFAQCMAKDLAPHGVRVNTVCPGMVQTPLNRSVWQAWHDQAAAGASAYLRGVGRREDPRRRPAGPLADARGHRRHDRLPRPPTGPATSRARRSTSTADSSCTGEPFPARSCPRSMAVAFSHSGVGRIHQLQLPQPTCRGRSLRGLGISRCALLDSAA